jgi:asparagine synthase (glutamine-hydrolysing)
MMCGIAGLMTAHGLTAERMAEELQRMTQTLTHRGPDDAGVWCDASAGVGLGHRRLSIVDLSPLGHQPMVSHSGRYIITFNGEIYNYREVRAQLITLSHTFRSTSDTEVLLAAVEEWGLSRALQRCTGMFALGLWDARERILHLARDRFGEKPLYYGSFSGALLFGSELKALRANSCWSADIDRDALTLLLRRGYIPAPHSIFLQVRKVMPGSIVSVRIQGSGVSLSDAVYWSPREAFEAADRAGMVRSADDAVASIDQALRAAISRQMVADVPVGAFLSGGVDSSLIVALMQQLNTQPVRTFSMGFSEAAYNEAPFARQIAAHLGTHHTELMVTPRETVDVIPLLPRIYDEPFGDSSQIPTYLVSKLARTDVTVSLSGDAGDELFGGYDRYPLSIERWQRLARVPAAFRHLAGAAALGTPPWLLELLAGPAKLSKRWRRHGLLSDRLRERAPRWTARGFRDFYNVEQSLCQPGGLVPGASEPLTVANDPSSWLPSADDTRHMMFVDTCSYLPGDILVKVDRAAMAVSLETRVPFLDPEVATAAWRIPTAIQFADGRGKWPLRQLLQRHVPHSMFDRPKRGFEVPVAKWLRMELFDWADTLLAEERLRREGFFDSAAVRRRWRQHIDQDCDWSFSLWTILMFQAWLEYWNPRSI